VSKLGPEADFAVYRLAGGRSKRVATVRGGFGTTGQEIVVAVPLHAVVLDHGVTVLSVSRISSPDASGRALDRLDLAAA
jgi:hypothetical protein